MSRTRSSRYSVAVMAVSFAITALAAIPQTVSAQPSSGSQFQPDGGGASYLAEETGLTLREVEANGVRLSVATGGDADGPALLLVHGFLGNAYTWNEVAPLLAEDYQLVVPDMRGYGGSEITDEGYDGQTLAADFAKLMETLGHDAYHVMAFDMGAPPALLLAANHPDRVETLTYLEEPTMLPGLIADKIEMTPEDTAYGGLWWWMVAYSPSMTEVIVEDNERDFLSWFYDNYAVVEGAVDDRARAIYTADLTGPRQIHGWFGVYRELFETIEQTVPLEEDKVTTPILAIGGAESQGLDVPEDLRRVATDVTGHSLEGTAHFLAEEKPEELVRLFEEFVDRQQP